MKSQGGWWQANSRDMMTSKFNRTHLIPSFKVLESDDVVTAVISAKKREVKAPLRIEAQIIGTPRETGLDFKPSILFRKTFYLAKDIYLVPWELLDSVPAGFTRLYFGHLDCRNQSSSIAEQTQVPIVT